MLHLNFSFTYSGVELPALMSHIPTVGLSKLQNSGWDFFIYPLLSAASQAKYWDA